MSAASMVWRLTVAGESYEDRGIVSSDHADLAEARSALARHEYRAVGVYWAYAEPVPAGAPRGLTPDHPARVWLVGGRA